MSFQSPHWSLTHRRALASGNATLSHFTISKSYFINYTIPFYNTPNIPKFYFAILHIKLIFYIIIFFFPIFSSTFPQPLSPYLHYPVTTTAPPTCPPRHHCPLLTKIPPEQKPILKKKKPRRKGRTQKNQLTMR